METPADILGPGGRIAQRLPRYEHRQQQLDLADAVVSALRDGKHLVAEAGTGVGKSFAYLVPAILRATEEPVVPEIRDADDRGDDEPRKRRMIVSTPRSTCKNNCWGRTCRCCAP